jgi:beta-glucanase (GH16 family)
VASSGITTNSATVTWNTNESSNSQVEYGTTTSYGTSTTLNSSLVTNHSVNLTGLNASTVYHYRVKSRDASNNLATSADYTFTTSAADDPPATTTSSDPSPSSGGPSGSGWTLTFSDEFNGTSLDTSKWYTTLAGGRRNQPENGELQYYVDNAFTVSSGTLKITTKEQSTNGLPYTSGLIRSKNFLQTYGYFEARMKLPAGKGFWPAFWLLPQNVWPPEIDIMENKGGDISRVSSAIHRANSSGGYGGNQTIWFDGLDSGFHVFAAEWNESEVVIYIDGVQRGRFTSYIPTIGMYIIANLAVGGQYPGNPDSSTPFPSQLEIDYIRAYSKTGNTGSTPPNSTPPATDTTAPVISSVQATNITNNSAIITWTTNEASDSQVNYGRNTRLGTLTPLDSSMVNTHSVSLSGLNASTLYYFRVISKDAAGNSVTSSRYSFTTAANAIENRPPELTAVGNKTVNEGQTLNFTISANDPDGNSLSYTASGLPAGAAQYQFFLDTQLHPGRYL